MRARKGMPNGVYKFILYCRSSSDRPWSYIGAFDSGAELALYMEQVVYRTPSMVFAVKYDKIDSP